MTDIVKEAIADARQLRIGAIENAKAMLQEKFMPKLEAMIEETLIQEEDDDDDLLDEVEATEKDIEIDITDNPEDDDLNESEDDDLNESEDDDDLELETLLRELEDEDLNESEDEDLNESEDEDLNESEDEDLELETLLRELEDEDLEDDLTEDEDLDLDDISESDIRDILNSLTEAEDDEDEDLDDDFDLNDLDLDDDGDLDSDDLCNCDEVKEENFKLKRENKKLKGNLTEAYDAIKLMKDKINEVNLMNSKLLYTNKLFNNTNYDLTESQKMGILETFDKATTLNEVKLVYNTFTTNLKESKNTKSPLKGFASDTIVTESKKVQPETNSMINRWQALAGMKDAY